MNQEVMNYVKQKMSPFLDNEQALRLEKVLEEVLLSKENDTPYEEDKMLIGIPKNVRAITTENLRLYLSDYQTTKNVSKVTIDNIRRNLSSFFTWLNRYLFITIFHII